MKRKVSTVICADLLFIFFLCMAGMLEGVISSIVYYSSFFVATAFALFADKRGDDASDDSVRLKINASSLVSLIPVIPLTVGTIFVISLVTTLILSLCGFSDSVTLEGNIFYIIFIHALLPAVLEEMLFRYVPLRLLSDRSARVAVLLSALFFGLSHTNLFQIPYAIIAGIILAAIDVAYDSVIPSVIVHFINNICSVFWMLNWDSPNFALIYITVLGIIFLASLVAVILKRKKYMAYIKKAFGRGEPYKPGKELYIMIGLTLFLAVTVLLF